MKRGPFGRRYWSSLTGTGFGPTAERDWRGQPFWRRYVASFFVLPQPARPPQQAEAETARESQTDNVSAPQRDRSPWFLRYQAAVLTGAAALTVVMVSVTLVGRESNGSGNTAPGTTAPSLGGETTPSPIGTPSPTSPTGSPTTSVPPTTQGWQGSIRVDGKSEHVTAGPKPAAGQVFGLTVRSGPVLDGFGNLAKWTQDGPATKGGCAALLKGGAVYNLTVQTDDQLCLETLGGAIASAKVTGEGQDAFAGPYVDLDVAIYPS